MFHLTRILNFQNEEEKNDFFFTYHITLMFPTQKLQS